MLAKTVGDYVAFDDRCPHRGGPLAGRVMIAGVVQCPWHGSQFNCRSGIVRTGPTAKPIAIYHVSEREGSRLALGNQ